MTALLTVEEAAAALHSSVTISAIRAAIRDGRLTHTRIGKRYYVTPQALARFAKCRDRRSPPASGSAATAPGSSSTPAASIGQAQAEKAAADLLKKHCGTISQGDLQRAAARLSRLK